MESSRGPPRGLWRRLRAGSSYQPRLSPLNSAAVGLAQSKSAAIERLIAAFAFVSAQLSFRRKMRAPLMWIIPAWAI